MLTASNSENLSPHKTSSPATQSFTDIINMHMKVPNCSLMLEGYNNSEKIFFYCTCDPEYQNPICESCLYICHKQHWKEKQLAEIIELSEERTKEIVEEMIKNGLKVDRELK